MTADSVTEVDVGMRDDIFIVFGVKNAANDRFWVQ